MWSQNILIACFGCGIHHKPPTLHVSRCDIGQTTNLKITKTDFSYRWFLYFFFYPSISGFPSSLYFPAFKLLTKCYMFVWGGQSVCRMMLWLIISAEQIVAGLFVCHQIHVDPLLLYSDSYWTCSRCGIGRPTWLTTANLPVNTWESTHTLHWPCLRSKVSLPHSPTHSSSWFFCPTLLHDWQNQHYITLAGSSFRFWSTGSAKETNNMTMSNMTRFEVKSMLCCSPYMLKLACTS